MSTAEALPKSDDSSDGKPTKPLKDDLPKSDFWRGLVVDDPLVMFFYRARNKLFWLAILLVLGLVAQRYFADVQMQSRRASSDILSGVQSALSELKSSNQEIGDLEAKAGDLGAEESSGLKDLQDLKMAVKRKLEGSIRTLKEQEQPYSQLAVYYEILTWIEEGEVESIRTQAEQIDFVGLEGRHRMFAEFAVLAACRYLIDQANTRSLARELLEKVANEGTYAAVPGAISFSRTAIAKAEKEKSLEVLNALVARMPEQRSLVEDELARLSSQT